MWFRSAWLRPDQRLHALGLELRYHLRDRFPMQSVHVHSESHWWTDPPNLYIAYSHHSRRGHWLEDTQLATRVKWVWQRRPIVVFPWQRTDTYYRWLLISYLLWWEHEWMRYFNLFWHHLVRFVAGASYYQDQVLPLPTVRNHISWLQIPSPWIVPDWRGKWVPWVWPKLPDSHFERRWSDQVLEHVWQWIRDSIYRAQRGVLCYSYAPVQTLYDCFFHRWIR